MNFIEWLVAFTVLIELLMFNIKQLWKIKKWLTLMLVVIGTFSGSGLLFLWPNAFTAVFFIVSLFRVFNYIRIAQNRINGQHLYRSSKQTSLSLIFIQLIDLAVWLGVYSLSSPSRHRLGIILLWLIAVMSFVSLVSTIRNLKKSKLKNDFPINDLSDLPTVSVCVPARNETSDLQSLLLSLIASNYPKLEILVLDDCSADRRTSDIIRGFAHDGVRFIQGSLPSDTWLAKNWAYEQLLKESSGEIILFCGVDTRFNVSGLSEIIQSYRGNKLKMMSILPRRPSQVGSSFVQFMRYWWEIVPPRQLVNRPAVLSTCWLINRKTIKKMGGFKSVSRSISPEAHFAKILNLKNQYLFVRSNKYLGISSYKTANDQMATAIRTRYPQLHRKPEMVFMAGLLESVFFILPFILLVYMAIIGSTYQYLWPLIVSCAILVICYVLLVVSIMPKAAILSVISFPFVMTLDIVIMLYSMCKYEFSTVDWKGRNICLPVMNISSSIRRD